MRLLTNGLTATFVYYILKKICPHGRIQSFVIWQIIFESNFVYDNILFQTFGFFHKLLTKINRKHVHNLPKHNRMCYNRMICFIFNQFLYILIKQLNLISVNRKIINYVKSVTVSLNNLIIHIKVHWLNKKGICVYIKLFYIFIYKFTVWTLMNKP